MTLDARFEESSSALDAEFNDSQVTNTLNAQFEEDSSILDAIFDDNQSSSIVELRLSELVDIEQE